MLDKNVFEGPKSYIVNEIPTWSESPSANIRNIECFLRAQGLPRHAPQGVLQLQHLPGQVNTIADPITVPELLRQPLLPKQTASHLSLS